MWQQAFRLPLFLLNLVSMFTLPPRKDLLPLAISLLSLYVPLFIMGGHLVQSKSDVFPLPSDDAFLQLSTAKTLAFEHVWGISKYHFEAASPSLLYPCVLAVPFFLFGLHLVIVPILNAVIATAFLLFLQRWLAKQGIASITQLFVLPGVVILTALPVSVLYGMEHPLLLLLAFLFISRVMDEWDLRKFSRNTLIFGALTVATNYDGALLTGGICLLLLFRRRWMEAYEMILWSLLPVLLFGFIALHKGSYFLPNAFMVESLGGAFAYDWLLGCAIAIAAPLSRRFGGIPISRSWRWTVVPGLIAVGIIAVMGNVYAFRASNRSSMQTYREGYPIGQFIHRYYYRYPIAANDVGILSFLSESRFLDLSGLASNKVARSKNDHSFSRGLVTHLFQEERIVIAITSDGYDRYIPENWVRAATWQAPGIDGKGEKEFFFFVRDTVTAGTLIGNLKEYAYFLRDGQKVKYSL